MQLCSVSGHIDLLNNTCLNNNCLYGISSVCATNIVATNCICAANCLGIGGSSTCPLYVNGNACISNNIKSTSMCATNIYGSTSVCTPTVTTSGDMSLLSGAVGNSICMFGTPRTLANNVSNLGTASFRWICLYVVNGVNCSSDVNLKTNFCNVDPSDILGRYREMPVKTWEWKDKLGQRNIGPTAQDFNKAFKNYIYYEEETSISGSNHAGVQDAAIKALSICVEKMQSEITCLKGYYKK